MYIETIKYFNSFYMAKGFLQSGEPQWVLISYGYEVMAWSRASVQVVAAVSTSHSQNSALTDLGTWW